MVRPITIDPLSLVAKPLSSKKHSGFAFSSDGSSGYNRFVFERIAMPISDNDSFFRRWAPVACLTLSAFIFNTSEFIPIGLLTDIADDFQISEATAGLIITVYAWIVTILSLPLMLLVSKLEFKKLLLGVLALFAVSHILSAVAPSFITLMLSRIGVACSHAVFWSIASPLAVRIAPAGKKAAALSMVATGTAIAMIAGMPLGRVVGLYLGWRATFFSIAVVALLIMLSLLALFPTVAAPKGSAVAKLPIILQNKLLWGVYAITALLFTAHYTAYSFIEPFLAQTARMPEAEITWTLTLFGIAGILASILFSKYFDRMPKLFYFTATFGVGIFLWLLAASAATIESAMALCALWGMAFTIFGLVFQAAVIRLAPEGTPLAMSIYSGICNVGIGGGALIGGLVTTHAAIAHIGYAGGLFAMAGGLLCMLWLAPKIARL